MFGVVSCNVPFFASIHARNAENDTIYALNRKMRGGNQGFVQAADRPQRPVGVGAAQLRHPGARAPDRRGRRQLLSGNV